jgi:hypothetical protein
VRYLTRAWRWLTAAARHLRPPTFTSAPAAGCVLALAPLRPRGYRARRRWRGIPEPGLVPLPGRHCSGISQQAEARRVLLSPAARRGRAVRSRQGMIRLLAIAHQINGEAGAVTP